MHDEELKDIADHLMSLAGRVALSHVGRTTRAEATRITDEIKGVASRLKREAETPLSPAPGIEVQTSLDGNGVLVEPKTCADVRSSRSAAINDAGLDDDHLFLGKDGVVYTAYAVPFITKADHEVVANAQLYVCQCCGRVGAPAPIQNVYERVRPGEIMPAGECPTCHELIHQLKQKL